MPDRARKKSDEAIAASRRVAAFAHSLSSELEGRSEGVPIRPLSEDDSMVQAIDEAVDAQRRAKRCTGKP